MQLAPPGGGSACQGGRIDLLDQGRQRAFEHRADEAHQLCLHQPDGPVRGDGGEERLHQNRLGERGHLRQVGERRAGRSERDEEPRAVLLLKLEIAELSNFIKNEVESEAVTFSNAERAELRRVNSVEEQIDHDAPWSEVALTVAKKKTKTS